MSAMSNLHLSIAEEIERGELTFREIATEYDVDLDTVCLIAQDLIEFYSEQ